MHDNLEGAAPLEIKNLLGQHINVKKYHALSEYNERLINFNCKYSDNKPVPIFQGFFI